MASFPFGFLGDLEIVFAGDAFNDKGQ